MMEMAQDSCEVDIIDVRTEKVLFVVQLYGVSALEMMVVPPPVHLREVLERRGIDTKYLTSSPFHVRPARRHRYG
jgi:hypothetical protein